MRKLFCNVMGLAAAVAAAGCASQQGSPHADYTYCSRYGNAPECGVKRPAVAAAPVAAARDDRPPQRRRSRPGRKPWWWSRPGRRRTGPASASPKSCCPPSSATEPAQQLVKPARERLEYSQAVYEDAEERVLVKPASKRVTVVPAQYGEAQEKVLVREAYRRQIEVPALYNTYYDRVMDRPARDVWKPGRGKVEKVDPTTGEILCLVHEQAVYKTVERKELFRAASQRYEDVPAQYATVRKTVLKTPESVQEVEVPAEYQTVKVRRLVKAPEPVKVPVPAVYTTVNKQVMVRPERTEWVQVLCDVNATPAKITQVERALRARGYRVRIDGEIDEVLTICVKQFQHQNGLRPTGLMTADTLAKLGVTLK